MLPYLRVFVELLAGNTLVVGLSPLEDSLIAHEGGIPQSLIDEYGLLRKPTLVSYFPLVCLRTVV